MAVMEAELSWGFFGWQRFVEDSITAEAEAKQEKRANAIIKRMVARWTHTLLVKIVLAWQADTIDEKRRRASEQRLLLRIKNRGIAQAYLQWCHHVSERRFLRATLNRCAQTNSPPAQTHVDPHPPYPSPCRCVMAVMEAELSWGFFGWQRFVEDSITTEAKHEATLKEQELLEGAKVLIIRTLNT